jgi:2-keto-4-pentenoate hydratase/2-oxohepta-3-ene-1,7-dioic acid hydratase in catechol pathway
MRIAIFEESDNIRGGLVFGDKIRAFDIEIGALGIASIDEDFLQNPVFTGEEFAISDIELLSPVLVPPRIFGIGLNYADHAIETGRPIPQNATWFMKQTTSVNEPNGFVDKPSVSDCLDFEVELVIIIGKTCRHVPQNRAHEVILGYCVGCDYSVRDWQTKTTQFTLGKGFDSHAPFGPFLVTPDEIENIDELGLRCFVNGQIMQNGKIGDMIFKIPQLIEEATKVMTLLPGDVIFTGTPAGVGMARNPQIWLKDGDIVRCEIDNIGAIENRIINENVETIIE